MAESKLPSGTVTLLFTDVTGSTALGEQLDPEAYRGVMGRYFEVAREAVERHGGTVEKFVGDAVMAVFGSPVAYPDHPRRAVRAALGVGFLRGGTVGVGTLVFAVGIGPVVEVSFWLLGRTPLAAPAVASSAA